MSLAPLVDALLDHQYMLYACDDDVLVAVEDRDMDYVSVQLGASGWAMVGSDLVKEYYKASSRLNFFHFTGRLAQLLLEETENRDDAIDRVPKHQFEQFFKDASPFTFSMPVGTSTFASPYASSGAYASSLRSIRSIAATSMVWPVPGTPAMTRDPMGAAIDQIVVPDSIEPLIGWRAWRVDRFGSLLSRTCEVAWPGGSKLVASCNASGGHDTPQVNCSCGIYSVKTLEGAIRYVSDGNWGSSDVAIGKIKVWGRVVQATKGYRSEFAYPIEVYLLRPTGKDNDLAPGDARIAERIQRRYDVPAIASLDLDDLIDMTLEEGETNGGIGTGAAPGPPDG